MNSRFSLSAHIYLDTFIPGCPSLFLFSQDDYRVCMDFNIIQKDSAPVCPVDASGCFTEEVTHFVGQYVKVCGLCYMEGCRAHHTYFSLFSSKEIYSTN